MVLTGRKTSSGWIHFSLSPYHVLSDPHILNELQIKLLDEYADLQKPVDGTTGCIAACMALKRRKPGLKVLVSIGGGSGSQHFAALASKPAPRERFAQAAALLVSTHGFDGVDLDWEHPSTAAQGADFVCLVQALRRHLPSSAHLLTAALPVGEYVLQHLDLRLLARSLSFLNLMAYDFAGAWTDGLSGHHAQLTAPPAPHSSFATKSGAGAVAYVLGRGVPRGKVVLGVPVYGRSFRGVTGPGERFGGCGGADGTWLYSDLPRPGTVQSVDWEVGGACCRGDGEGGGGVGEWVSYDCVETVRMKAEFVRRVGIAGLFYWTGVGDKEGEESLVAAGWGGLGGDVRLL